MKPAPFLYHRPTDLEEALQLLAEAGPEGRPLAGGQSLVPAMNYRLAKPAVLVDLNRVHGLTSIESSENCVRVGAMVRQAQAEKDAAIEASVPLLAEAIPWIAHPQIRNRGTIGGSLAHADPAAELPVVAMTLGARLRLQSAAGERWVEAADFFLGLFMTALQPGELLTEIEFPAASDQCGVSFQEFSRRHGDYALAGAAAVIELDPTGVCRRCRLCLLNVADTALPARGASSILEGQALNVALLQEAACSVSDEIDPVSDLHASADYRSHLARIMAMRALESAWQRARATLDSDE